MGLAVFAKLCEHAPSVANSYDWRGRFALRSSHCIADALSTASSRQLVARALVSVCIVAADDERGSVTLEAPLDGGLTLHVSGSVQRRTISGSHGLLYVTFNASELTMTERCAPDLRRLRARAFPPTTAPTPTPPPLVEPNTNTTSLGRARQYLMHVYDADS